MLREAATLGEYRLSRARDRRYSPQSATLEFKDQTATEWELSAGNAGRHRGTVGRALMFKMYVWIRRETQAGGRAWSRLESKVLGLGM